MLTQRNPVWARLTAVVCLLILLVGLTGPAQGRPAANQAGWEWQNTVAEGQLLFDVWGSSGADVWAVGGRAAVHYDGDHWSLVDVGVPANEGLAGVWGAAGNDVFVVGSGGVIRRYDGHAWSPMNSAASVNLNAVWGASGSDVFAVGYDHTVLHYDGVEWVQMDTGSGSPFVDVWGSAGNDVWAVDLDGDLYRYDGADWSQMAVPPTYTLRGVWVRAANDVYAVGAGCGLLHYDGLGWTDVYTTAPGGFTAVWGGDVFCVGGHYAAHYDGSQGTSVWLHDGSLYGFQGLWGSSSSDVFAVGSHGVIYHYDGSAWAGMDGGLAHWLYDVWGSAGDDVFAVGGVGPEGVILHYDGDRWRRTPGLASLPPRGIWGWGANLRHRRGRGQHPLALRRRHLDPIARLLLAHHPHR